MSDSENAGLLKQAYELLIRDDVPGFLKRCARDAEWHYPEVAQLPYGGRWPGHHGIERFLETHDEAEEILDFRPEEYIVEGDRVVALGYFQGRAKPQGRIWDTRFVHVVTFRDGNIQRFEAYFDTAAAVEARR